MLPKSSDLALLAPMMEWLKVAEWLAGASSPFRAHSLSQSVSSVGEYSGDGFGLFLHKRSATLLHIDTPPRLKLGVSIWIYKGKVPILLLHILLWQNGAVSPLWIRWRWFPNTTFPILRLGTSATGFVAGLLPHWETVETIWLWNDTNCQSESGVWLSTYFKVSIEACDFFWRGLRKVQ